MDLVTAFHHSNRNYKPEIGSKILGQCCDRPNHELFCGRLKIRMWRTVQMMETMACDVKTCHGVQTARAEESAVVNKKLEPLK